MHHPKVSMKKPKKGADIEEGDYPITVKGMVVTGPVTNDAAASRGRKATVSSFELEDDTGGLRFLCGKSLWMPTRT